MIRVLIITLIATSLVSSQARGKDVDLSRLSADREACYGGYRPRVAWLRKSSVRWKAESEILPLSPAVASRIARQEFKRYMQDYVEMSIEIGNVRLHQVKGIWCYTVGISFHRRDIQLTGVPFWACVHVRMDGVAKVHETPLVTPEPTGLLLDRDKKNAGGVGDRKPVPSPARGMAQSTKMKIRPSLDIDRAEYSRLFERLQHDGLEGFLGMQMGEKPE